MSEPSVAKKLLIAVDASENSSRAVDYVIRMLGGQDDVAVTLLHLVQEPEEDFFRTPEERRTWLEEHQGRMAAVLEAYRQRLLAAGFGEARVAARLSVRRCPTVSGCILDEAERESPDAIVVGRKGISAKEEFLFGSVSSGIVHNAKGCAVWVVN